MKKLVGLMIVIMMVGVFAVACLAEEGESSSTSVIAEEESSSASLPFSNEVSVGNHIINISTRNPIDTSVLLEGINENDDFASISSKIESKRLSLYPDEEIEVKISDHSDKSGKRSKRASSTQIVQVMPSNSDVKLFEKETISQSNPFTRTFTCNLVTFFIYVRSGSVKVEKFENGSWTVEHPKISYYKTQFLTSQGDYSKRGFRVTPLGAVGSKATVDIVRLYFKTN